MSSFHRSNVVSFLFLFRFDGWCCCSFVDLVFLVSNNNNNNNAKMRVRPSVSESVESVSVRNAPIDTDCCGQALKLYRFHSTVGSYKLKKKKKKEKKNQRHIKRILSFIDTSMRVFFLPAITNCIAQHKQIIHDILSLFWRSVFALGCDSIQMETGANTKTKCRGKKTRNCITNSRMTYAFQLNGGFCGFTTIFNLWHKNDIFKIDSHLLFSTHQYVAVGLMHHHQNNEITDSISPPDVQLQESIQRRI